MDLSTIGLKMIPKLKVKKIHFFIRNFLRCFLVIIKPVRLIELKISGLIDLTTTSTLKTLLKSLANTHN